MKNPKQYGLFAKIITHSSQVILAKDAGFDFIFYDMEHSFYSFEMLHDLIMLGNSMGIKSFVRARRDDSGNLSVILDCGASGVMLPMVETVDQAKDLVKYTKYPPIGMRGYSSGANTFYQRYANHRESMDIANEKVVTIAQIESKKGIENVEKIAALDGIDALVLGPVDLSISLGLENDFLSPIITDSIDKIVDACNKHKKLMGIIGQKILIEKYYNSLDIIVNSIDVNIIRDGFIQSRIDVQSIGRNANG